MVHIIHRYNMYNFQDFTTYGLVNMLIFTRPTIGSAVHFVTFQSPLQVNYTLIEMLLSSPIHVTSLHLFQDHVVLGRF